MIELLLTSVPTIRGTPLFFVYIFLFVTMAPQTLLLGKQTTTTEPPNTTSTSTSKVSVPHKLPPIFDFNVYKQTFHKHYATAITELRRRALFIASCLRVLPIMAAFKVGITSYSAGLNWDSDLTKEERQTRRSGVNKRRPTPANNTNNRINRTEKNRLNEVTRGATNGERKRTMMEYSMTENDDADDSVDSRHLIDDSRRKKRRLMKSSLKPNTKQDIDFLNLLNDDYVRERLLQLLDKYKDDDEMFETILDYANDNSLFYESAYANNDQFVLFREANNKKRRIRDFVTQSSSGVDNIANGTLMIRVSSVNKKQQTSNNNHNNFEYEPHDERLDNDYDYELDPPRKPDHSAGQERKLRSNSKLIIIVITSDDHI